MVLISATANPGSSACCAAVLQGITRKLAPTGGVLGCRPWNHCPKKALTPPGSRPFAAGQLMSSTGRQVTGSFRWHPVSSVARSRTGAPHSSNSIPIVRVICGVLPEKCNTSHTAPQLAAESSSSTTGEMRRYTVRFAVCSSGVPVRRITAMQSPASRMLSAAYQHTAVTKRRSPCSPKATPTTAQAVSILYRIWAGYESSGANKISALSAAMPLAHTMRENAACWLLSSPAACSKK